SGTSNYPRLLLGRYPLSTTISHTTVSESGSTSAVGGRTFAMRAALGVGLPEFDPRPSDRLPLDVQDPSHHMDHLSRRASLPSGDGGQIRTPLDPFDDGIKRSEDFPWSPLERLGEHCTDSRHRKAAGGKRHTQNTSA